MTDEQFAKLPKFARDEIQQLRANVRHAEERLNRTLRSADDNQPAYGDYDDNRGKGLPCRIVRFQKFGVDVRVGRDGVELHGDGSLVVRPVVSNVISVASEHTYTD